MTPIKLGDCLTGGHFLQCRSSLFRCLPPNATDICIPVIVLPQVSVVPQNQSLLIPVLQNARAKRDIIILPFLAAVGVLTGVGTGVASLAYGTTQIQQLANPLNTELQHAAASIIKLQDQTDSLADAAFQNRRALDLLLAEKGGTCIFLGEQCCFFTNKSGVVRNMAQQLKECIAK